MSGVGCVQIGCTSIANAKLSYTRACICLDGFKGCYEPVDSSGANCGPNCPYSRLVACVDSGALCPGEEPTAEPDPEPTEDPTTEPNPQPSPEADPEPSVAVDTDPGDQGQDDGLVNDLAEFLAGEGVTDPSAGQAAAGGVALSTLIATWVLINALSGTPISELLQAVGLWGQKPGSSATPQPGAGTATPSGPQIQQAQVPGIPLSTSGVVPGRGPQPGRPAQPAVPPTAGATPPVAPAQQTPSAPKPPAEEVPPDRFPDDADPLKVQQLTQRFQDVVADKIREGYYVRNTGLINKIWNQTIGRGSDIISGHKGGQCGEFADWGAKWSEPIVKEIFGDAAIVDTVYIGETSTRYPDGFLNAADALYEANHAATRVILPTGESYILDYWAAVGDQQMELGTDYAHQLIFDEPRQRDRIQLIPEKDWIATWKQKIGPNDSEAHNMHYAMSELQSAYNSNLSEVEAIQAWRNQRYPGVPPHQMQTILNNWHRNNVHWERP